jgi:alcohol dehydrogenase (cytochrome c)
MDRGTGQFLMGKPFAKLNWLEGFDEKGRPRRVPGKVATKEGTFMQPTILGATNWYPPSFSPRTGYFYIPGIEDGATYNILGIRSRNVAIHVMGDVNLKPNYRTDNEGYGNIRAFDPKTGERKWEFKMGDTTWGGVLTTASDVLFSGGREGYFFALDARDGKELWRASLGGQINAGPMTYSVNGKQYVTVAAGTSLFAFRLRP